jgi:hypothetical protein
LTGSGTSTPQTWITSNLKHVNTGTSIATFGQDTPAIANYYNAETINAGDGYLYNRDAATSIINDTATMEGYRVANISDYITLVNRLTGETMVVDGTTAGSSNLINLLTNGTTGLNLTLGGAYLNVAGGYFAKGETDLFWAPGENGFMALFRLDKLSGGYTGSIITAPAGAAARIRLIKA